jgi:hypothetical protein
LAISSPGPQRGVAGPDAHGAGGNGYGNWFALTLLSMLAVMFLPRQFQVAVVENVNENHLRRASGPAVPAADQHFRAAHRAGRADAVCRAEWMPTPSC